MVLVRSQGVKLRNFRCLEETLSTKRMLAQVQLLMLHVLTPGQRMVPSSCARMILAARFHRFLALPITSQIRKSHALQLTACDGEIVPTSPRTIGRDLLRITRSPSIHLARMKTTQRELKVLPSKADPVRTSCCIHHASRTCEPS
jgi:hypothetical protein